MNFPKTLGLEEIKRGRRMEDRKEEELFARNILNLPQPRDLEESGVEREGGILKYYGTLSLSLGVRKLVS